MHISRDLHLTKFIIFKQFNSSCAITTHIMYSEQMVTPASWNFMNGQLTPTSESSRSSIGSAGPPSPSNSSTPYSNDLLPLDSETNYDQFFLTDQAWYRTSSKPLTWSHTLAQDTFLDPRFYNILPYKQPLVDDESMLTFDYSHSGRPSDICSDEIYSSFTFTSALSTKLETMRMSYPQSTVFSQMLEAANNQHLSAKSKSPLAGQAGDQKCEEYPFVPRQRRQPNNMSNFIDCSPEFPSTLSSMESSSSKYEPDNSDMKKPSGSNADGGTYTCTYHGCTLRFETPAKLQKHKREGHRQSAPLVGGTSTTPAASQAGPHKCVRISPQTGKSCNVIFSRPYDLTREYPCASFLILSSQQLLTIKF